MRKKDVGLFNVFKHEKKVRRGEGGGDWKYYGLTGKQWGLAGGIVSCYEVAVIFLGMGFEERERIEGEKKGILKGAARNGGGLIGDMRTAEMTDNYGLEHHESAAGVGVVWKELERETENHG